MKTKTLSLVALLCLSISIATTAQNWTTYNTGSLSTGVNDVVVESNGSIWFTNLQGLTQFNGTTMIDFPSPSDWGFQLNCSKITIDNNGNKWMLVPNVNFTVSFDGSDWVSALINNKDIPYSKTGIAVDNNNNIWIATTDGAFIYNINAESWTTHTDPSYSQMHSVFFDRKNNIWIGANGVIAKYDGVSWYKFAPDNNWGQGNEIYSITDDIHGNKWIGGQKGLFKYNDTIFTQWKTSTSGLISDTIKTVATDSKGNVWIGTLKGVQKFNGTTWTTYTTQNSQLINNNINSIAVDSKDNIWIATPTGVSMFNEKAVTAIIPDTLIQKIDVNTIIENTVYLPTKDTCALNYNVPVDTFYVAKTSLVGNEIEFEWIFVQGSDSVFIKQSSPLDNVTNGNNMVYMVLRCDKSKSGVKMNTFGALAFVDDLITTNLVDKNSEKINVSVYPNPTQSTLFINTNNSADVFNVQIINSIGQVMYKNITNNNDVLQIDVSNWSNGIYFIHYNNLNNSNTISFIKN